MDLLEGVLFIFSFPVMDFWPPPPTLIFVPLSPSVAAVLSPHSLGLTWPTETRGMGVQYWREGGTRNPNTVIEPLIMGKMKVRTLILALSNVRESLPTMYCYVTVSQVQLKGSRGPSAEAGREYRVSSATNELFLTSSIFDAILWKLLRKVETKK